MADRLSRIYTRTGDDGATGMADGTRVSKDSLLMSAIGDVDELNSQLAVLLCSLPECFIDSVHNIQNNLFNAGAELAMNEAMISQQHVDELEQSLDALNANLPPLKEFILPGGGTAASQCHVARAVCRRAERTFVALDKSNQLNKHLKAYINRLSDYLFVLARAISKQQGESETYWQSDRMNNE